MDKKPTKDRIIESALTLFSEKGYDGVGVDLIAETAGLKGPSIYKHFKGKEEVLEVILERVEEHYEMNFGSKLHTGNIPASMEELVKGALKRIEFTMHDEMIQKTRRILTMEQFRNPKIAGLATKYNIEGNQGLYQVIFEKMMESGAMKKGDARMMAMAFTAPITLLIQRYDREPECEKENMKQIKAYFKAFAATYGN